MTGVMEKRVFDKVEKLLYTKVIGNIVFYSYQPFREDADAKKEPQYSLDENIPELDMLFTELDSLVDNDSVVDSKPSNFQEGTIMDSKDMDIFDIHVCPIIDPYSIKETKDRDVIKSKPQENVRQNSNLANDSAKCVESFK